MNLVDILTRPALNGLYRLDGVQLPSLLDARALDTRERLLAAIGHALDFPEYYGQNWDALEECLNDMSWRDGPILLCIERARAGLQPAPERPRRHRSAAGSRLNPRPAGWANPDNLLSAPRRGGGVARSRSSPD